jgi:hypothetical protein
MNLPPVANPHDGKSQSPKRFRCPTRPRLVMIAVKVFDIVG